VGAVAGLTSVLLVLLRIHGFSLCVEPKSVKGTASLNGEKVQFLLGPREIPLSAFSFAITIAFRIQQASH
jgi:hypothetical protein